MQLIQTKLNRTCVILRTEMYRILGHLTKCLQLLRISPIPACQGDECAQRIRKRMDLTVLRSKWQQHQLVSPKAHIYIYICIYIYVYSLWLCLCYVTLRYVRLCYIYICIVISWCIYMLLRTYASHGSPSLKDRSNLRWNTIRKILGLQTLENHKYLFCHSGVILL